MAQYNKLPVFKATYELLLAIFLFTKEFIKEYKYTIEESLKKETVEVLALIYRANTRNQNQMCFKWQDNKSRGYFYSPSR